MGESAKYIRAVASKTNGVKTNAPEQYGDRQKQIYSKSTRRFAKERAKYSSDFVLAQIQGLGADFYEYAPKYIRLDDITQNSVYSSRRADDYKQILIADGETDYLPIGAKIVTMGNTWLTVNPRNMSSVNANAIIARCNASYNSYDEYGNVITEPIVVEKVSMLGNDVETENNMVLMEGYFNITAQNNDNTEKLYENARIILGKKAYHLTGFTDFIQEFTGDRESNHLITFTARVEEPTELDDITEHFIANGKKFTFGAEINGESKVYGQTTLTADFLVNGEVSELPCDWIWQSSNEDVATVDNGVVTVTGAGESEITATLSQNPAIAASHMIVAESAPSAPYVAFIGATQDTIKQFSSATYTAAYFDGEQTEEPITWSLSPTSAALLKTNGNTATVTCLKPSRSSVVLTAACNGKTAITKIELEGY